MDPSFPVFPIFSFLGVLLAIVPLASQFEVWNVGALWFILWTVLPCITQYFNSFVWLGNTVNSAPAWCEITIRVMMGASVGIPAASLCINRRLYCIVSLPPTAVVSKQEKRRDMIIDSFICGLIPLLYMCLQIAVQRHRFDILEDIGCTVALYNNLPTYFISCTPPLILSFGSAVYLALSQNTFAAVRATVADGFVGHKNLTSTRFLRLSGLAFAALLVTVPLGLLSIATVATAARLSNRATGDAAPFHFNFIAQVPRRLWFADQSYRFAVELTRWEGPICALLFFAFFGLAAEARVKYSWAFGRFSIAFWNGAARMGITRALPPLPGAGSQPKRSFIEMGPIVSRPKPSRTRTYEISAPIRPLSGTGSFVDFSRPTRIPTYSSAAGPSTQYASTPGATGPKSTSSPTMPPSAASGRSFVQVIRPSSTAPNRYVLPPYQGWHHFSNADGTVEPENLIGASPRAIERASPKTGKASRSHRGRKLV